MIDYKEKCKTIFGRTIDDPNEGFYIPFQRGSEEAMRLLQHLWREENRFVESLYDTILNDRIPGAFIEFGVFEGKGLRRILQYVERKGGGGRNVYGFDSFEGLPDISVHDPSHWERGQYKAPYDEVRNFLAADQRKNLHLVKGWFCDSLNTSQIQQNVTEVAYARIDCDLYESAKDCLVFLDGRLSNGSIITFDDWRHRENLGETKAFFEWYETVKCKYTFEFLYTIAQGVSHIRVWHKS
ncbi:MAG: hypothetical protein EOL87_10405 [Spartobacteria bacterium]|nr:hypothetical protein [Spartobacteria bacterium]